MRTPRDVAPGTALGRRLARPAALLAGLAAALAATALGPDLALAQTKTPSPAATRAKPTAPAATQPAPAAARPAVPGGPALIILIQNTLLALNHANLTGNYSVLRDLAAPAFQSVNTPASLAENFTDLRRRNIDLSPIVLFQPKLVRQPAIDDKGLLRIVGYFDTRPEQVQFELLYARLGVQWRLFGLGVQTVPAQAAAGKAAPAEKEAAAPAKKK
ncbi:MAG TPA: hypothetical protein VH913_06780 [Hyphomicrobiaceae bacterium]|jgi:hypothetical protein